MSGADRVVNGTGQPISPWLVRRAEQQDADAVAEAVVELLVELGGNAPEMSGMQAAARELIDSEQLGIVLVAEDDVGQLVGVLAASWPAAIHAAGGYGLIQDLWVKPSWRGQEVGSDLLAAFARSARHRGITRLEVGLPRDTFAALASTQSFYETNGFAPLGPRLRRVIT
jgi:GNAT superfamily N-acetyltransferase